MIPVSLRGPLLAALIVVSATSPALAAAGGADLPPDTGDPIPGRTGTVPAPEPAEAGWWSVYRDPALAVLMARLHAANPTVAQAAARLAMARAEARLTAAAARPGIDLGGSASHAAGPLVNAAGQSGDLLTLRAGASWELDLLGRISAERRAARAEALAAEASLADVTLLMEASLARAWFARAALARATQAAVDAEQRLADAAALTARRQAAGLVTAAEVDAAGQRLRLAAARRRDLALERDSALRQIAALIDGPTTAEGAAPALPADLPDVPADLPADLLGRRPDLRAARLRSTAADARLSALRRGWLPPLTLTAARGQASTSLGQLFASAGSVVGLGALLALPIFDGGRHRAQVAKGKAERTLAEAAYREAVAQALRDVYDRLQTAQVRRQDLADSRDSERAAAAQLAIAEARAAHGTIAGSQLLDAQLQAIDRRIAAELAWGRGQVSLVALQEALGGGW